MPCRGNEKGFLAEALFSCWRRGPARGLGGGAGDHLDGLARELDGLAGADFGALAGLEFAVDDGGLLNGVVDRWLDDETDWWVADVIEYRLTFTNHQDGPVSDVVLNDPIPEGLVFVPGSVTGSRADLLIEYSIDGGSSWSERPEVDVDVAGQSERRPAPAEAYTHVRWTVTGAVNPGAQVTARFRARVAGAPNDRGDA